LGTAIMNINPNHSAQMAVPPSSRALFFKVEPTLEMADAASNVGTAKKKSTILGLKPSRERKSFLPTEWVP